MNWKKFDDGFGKIAEGIGWLVVSLAVIAFIIFAYHGQQTLRVKAAKQAIEEYYQEHPQPRTP